MQQIAHWLEKLGMSEYSAPRLPFGRRRSAVSCSVTRNRPTLSRAVSSASENSWISRLSASRSLTFQAIGNHVERPARTSKERVKVVPIEDAQRAEGKPLN
jgi:hypothetical protein